MTFKLKHTGRTVAEHCRLFRKGMMFRLMVAIQVIAIMPLVSCVKESRLNCPCYLYFAHQGFDANGYSGPVRLCVFEDGEQVLRHEYMMEQLLIDDAEVGIQKGMAEICGMGGITDMNLDSDMNLYIPYGSDCDPVYAFYSSVEATGERAKVYGRVHKQFCHVKIDLLADDSMKGSYALRVDGNVAGFDMVNFKPIPGLFHFVPSNADKGRFEFNIPRQIDDSLVFQIWGSETPILSEGTIPEGFIYYNTFYLGRYLKEEFHYDWQKESLNDVSIVIDYARCQITIKINEWEVVKMFTIFM